MPLRRMVGLCLLISSLNSPVRAVDGNDLAAGATSAATSAWESMQSAAGNVWAAIASVLIAPDPFEYLPERLPDRERRFLALMDAAGYPLVAIETDDGIVGHVSYRFEQRREASAGDLELVGKGLAEHTARYGGPLAAAERRAVRGLIGLADAASFKVAAVRVDVRPWPQVSFSLAARAPAGAAP